MRQLLDEYLKDGKRQHLRAKTLMDREKRVTAFLEYVEGNFPDVREVAEVTRDIVLSYEKALVSMLDSRGKIMSRERRYRYLSALKMFFDYLQKEEKAYRNPASRITLPKLKKAIVKDVLSVEEMDALLKNSPGDSAKSIRDRAILELLYSAGVRSEELCNVELADLDFTENLLYIRKGKLDRERIIPFGKSAHYWLKRYADTARPLMVKPSVPYLFASMTGTKLRPPTLVKIIKTLAKKAGIEKNVTTHTFRHTCASHMLKGRADIRYVQRQLGHTSIQSTEKYLRIEVSDLKEVHERCHPREREDW